MRPASRLVVLRCLDKTGSAGRAGSSPGPTHGHGDAESEQDDAGERGRQRHDHQRHHGDPKYKHDKKQHSQYTGIPDHNYPAFHAAAAGRGGGW